jgi:hypothetical protein
MNDLKKQIKEALQHSEEQRLLFKRLESELPERLASWGFSPEKTKSAMDGVCQVLERDTWQRDQIQKCFEHNLEVIQLLQHDTGSSSSGNSEANSGSISQVENVPVCSSFRDSQFLFFYRDVVAAEFQDELFQAVRHLILAVCSREGFESEDGIRFFKGLQREAMETAVEEVLDDVSSAAQRMWTSMFQFHGKEFCSWLNSAIRSNDRTLAQPAAIVARCINKNIVSRRPVSDLPWPQGSMCFRGGGLPDEHKAFFVPGRQYRYPGFLATSFNRATAQVFLTRAIYDQNQPGVMWIIHLDTRGQEQFEYRCKHVSYISASHFGRAEEEFLFVPYSPFTIQSVEWSDDPKRAKSPHIVHLKAGIDSHDFPEDLPSAPWG